MTQTDVLSLEGAGPAAGSHPPKTRVVILGGGFGGVYTARHLEQLCKRRPDVEIVLVSRDNFLLMTPLLFEVCSGALDLRHCSFPIRTFLRTTRFVEATVQGIATVVNPSVVTLLPLSNATTPATFTAGASQTLYGWRCGDSGDGTTVSPKYLPGSCRG